MPLSWLAQVFNFCFNLCLLFLSIVRFLSSQAISCQIFLYALFPRFSWSTVLIFHSYFKLHNLTYVGVDISSVFTTTPTLSRRTAHTLSTSITPTYPDYAMLHPTQPHLMCNSKFPRFTKLEQNWSNTTLINLPLLLQR